MRLLNRRVQNLDPTGAGAALRGSEWLITLSGRSIRFDQLGNGHGTWRVDITFNVPVTATYEMGIQLGQLQQMQVGAGPVPGRAAAGQRAADGRLIRKEKPVNAGDVISMYLEAGEARFQMEMPVTGDGQGAQPPELNFQAVATHTDGAVVLFSPIDWLPAAGEVPKGEGAPAGVPPGEPLAIS